MTLSVLTRVSSALLDNDHLVAVRPCGKGRRREEDAVHDAKGEARLEHVAWFAEAPVEAELRNLAAAYVVPPDLAVHGIVALSEADRREEVDGSNQGAHHANVDKGDEEGVVRRSVVGEERKDGPGKGEDGDDEHEEDRGRREGIVRDEDIDKPGEHAHRAELFTRLVDPAQQSRRGRD